MQLRHSAVYIADNGIRTDDAFTQIIDRLEITSSTCMLVRVMLYCPCVIHSSSKFYCELELVPIILFCTHKINDLCPLDSCKRNYTNI